MTSPVHFGQLPSCANVRGVVFALAPSRIEDALRALSELGIEKRRLFGLGALALGVLLVWIAKSLG